MTRCVALVRMIGLTMPRWRQCLRAALPGQDKCGLHCERAVAARAARAKTKSERLTVMLARYRNLKARRKDK